MSENNYENCAICDEEINIIFPYTTQLSCQHNNIFHQHCITRWIESKVRPYCPYCRSEIILTAEQLQRQQQEIEARYVRPVFDAETEMRLEEARLIERERIQFAIDERIRQIRAGRV